MRLQMLMQKKSGRHIILFLIIVLAGFLRYRLVFAGHWFPGINGGYYPLMVRELMETGRLPFPDAPLVFWVESLLTRLMRLFTDNTSQAILLSTRLTDVVLPPLLACPIYCLAMKKTGAPLISLLLAAFAILYFPMSYLLTGDMHKNAIGILWLGALFMTMVYWRETRKPLLLFTALMLYGLTALTHFGSLIIALLFIPLLIPQGTFRKNTPNTYLSFLPAGLLLLWVNSGRMDRIVGMVTEPLRLFEHPLIWYLIDGQPVLTPFLLAFGLVTHLLALVLLIVSLQHKPAIYWALIGCLLSSPLLGMEWYLRLTIMAYLPLIVAITLLWKTIAARGRKIIFTSILGLTLVSTWLTINGKRPSAISQNEITDLQEIQTMQWVGKNDLVIARHGLEWWTAWFLNCQVAQEQAVRTSDFKQYQQVFVLEQFTKKPGKYLRGQANFQEPNVNNATVSVYSGQSLRLYPTDPEGYVFFKANQTLAGVGQLSHSNGEDWVLTGTVYKNTLILSEKQKEALLSAFHPDNTYRIYGDKRAFSLKIKVTDYTILDAPPEN